MMGKKNLFLMGRGIATSWIWVTQSVLLLLDLMGRKTDEERESLLITG